VAEIFESTEAGSNSTNALADGGIFPFTQLHDLPENQVENITEYDTGQRDVNVDYGGEVVLGGVLVTFVGSVAFAASRLYMSKGKTKIVDSAKIITLGTQS